MGRFKSKFLPPTMPPATDTCALFHQALVHKVALEPALSQAIRRLFDCFKDYGQLD